MKSKYIYREGLWCGGRCRRLDEFYRLSMDVLKVIDDQRYVLGEC